MLSEIEASKLQMQSYKFGLLLCVFSLIFSASSFAQDKKEEEALFLAKKAFEDNFYDVGITLFQRFIDRYPASTFRAEADMYIGQCYFYQKKYIDALGRFKKLLDTPGAATLRDKLYYWIAEVYFKLGDFKQAYNFYDKLVLGYPNSVYAAHAFYSLGWCLLSQGDFEAAKERLAEFKDRYPDDLLAEEAAFKVAECLYNLRNYVQLKQYLGNFSREYPKHTKSAYLRFYLAESCFYTADYNSAIANYLDALKAVSDSNLTALIHFGLGWSYLKRGDYANSKDHFDQALQGTSDKKIIDSALLGEAIILQANSQFMRSAEAYAKLIAQAQTQGVICEAYLGKAESLYNLNHYQEAALAYRQAQACLDNEDRPLLADRLHYGLGLNYLKQGNFKEARREFSLLKDYPACDVCDYAQYSLSIALLDSKLYTDAIESFKELLVKYPKSQLAEEAIFYLATAYFEGADFLNCYLQLDTLLARYPLGSYRIKALLLEGLSLKALKKFQDAHDIFKTIIKDTSQDVHILARAEFEIADCLYYLGQVEEAIAKLESLRSKYADPEILGMALWRLSEHYFKENNFDLASRYLLSLIQDYSKGTLVNDAHYLLGLSFEKQGKYQEALEAFSKVKGREPEVYIKIADVFKAQGSYGEALTYYRRGLEVKNSDKPRLRFKLAECLEQLGNLGQAVQEYLKVSRDSPLAVKGLLRCGQIWERQENWQQAIDAYRKIDSLKVEESKFARERIAMIEEQYLGGKVKSLQLN